MCQDCGCSVTLPKYLPLVRPLLERNDVEARHNRAHFDAHGVLAVNLMSAPGSGKTLLLEATVRTLREQLPCAVIEGDLETDNDAARIRRHGVPAVQITTGSACHLDAHMVHDALHELPLDGLSLVFIENVGNLVCPASFALGAHRDVVLRVGDRRRRQACQVSRDVPSGRPRARDQGRPAGGRGRFRRGEDRATVCASSAIRPRCSRSRPARGRVSPGWLDWLRDEAALRRSATDPALAASGTTA